MEGIYDYVIKGHVLNYIPLEGLEETIRTLQI